MSIGIEYFPPKPLLTVFNPDNFKSVGLDNVSYATLQTEADTLLENATIQSENLLGSTNISLFVNITWSIPNAGTYTAPISLNTNSFYLISFNFTFTTGSLNVLTSINIGTNQVGQSWAINNTGSPIGASSIAGGTSFMFQATNQTLTVNFAPQFTGNDTITTGTNISTIVLTSFSP